MKTQQRNDAAYIIGNDAVSSASLEILLNSVRIDTHIFVSPIDFLRSFTADKPCCIIIEMRMPRLSGLELLAQLKQRQTMPPAIVVTAYGEVTSAVRAMKLGAVDVLEKPVNEELLLECVQSWISVHRAELEHMKKRAATEAKLAKLSPREREVLHGLLNGQSSKEIAKDLDVTPKAIELYRGKLMAKMEASSLAALIRETLCSSMSRAYQCNAAAMHGDCTRFRRPASDMVSVEEASIELIKASQYPRAMRGPNQLIRKDYL